MTKRTAPARGRRASPAMRGGAEPTVGEARREGADGLLSDELGDSPCHTKKT
jgi:hypothetical protein